MYLYEYVEDSTHIITTDPIACYGQEFAVQALSIGEGTYSWQVDHPVLVSDIPEHLCVNGAFPLDLSPYTSATPPGGHLSYTGDGLSGYGQFSPATSGAYTICMNYTDALGCTDRDTAVIQVVDPEPLVLETDTVMFTGSTYHVTVPAGGILLLDGVELEGAGGEFTIEPAQLALGYHTLHGEAVQGDYDCLSECDVTVNVVDRTSIREFDISVAIYPNPATTALTLTSTEPQEIDLHLIDITGKVVKTDRMSAQTHTLDVSDLSSGVYLLRLVSATGASKTVRVVKR